MRIIFLFKFLILFLGCTHQSENQKSVPEITVDNESVVEEGGEITVTAFQTLSTNLQSALNEGGVKYAIEFCNLEAMSLTDSLASHNGKKLRRASHQPRNPLNLADSLEMLSIQKYLDNLEAGGELPTFTYAMEYTISYHAPIRISNQLCLNCHGKPGVDIKASDLEIIQELYPTDEATDFGMGELRGIWSITFQNRILTLWM